MSDTLLPKWKEATHDLQWGVQHAFSDVLTLASEGKIDLVYNADYYGKGACLVNQAGSLLKVGGGYGIPMANFGHVVSLFDQLNRFFKEKGINTEDGKVSPYAAEILLHWFSPLHPRPEDVADTPQPTQVMDNTHYVEPTDEQISESLKKMFEAPVIIEGMNDLEPYQPEDTNAEANAMLIEQRKHED